MSDSKTTDANPDHHTWDPVNRHCMICGAMMMDSDINADCPEQGGVQAQATKTQTTITLPVLDLHKFCSDDGYRPHLANPFSRAGYTWATDGKIMVRAPLRVDIPDVDGVPHAERVWTDAKGEFVPVKPFKVPEPKRMQCDVCDGRGTEHDCPVCTCDCDQCDGTGQMEEAMFVSIGDSQTMQQRYAVKIMTLPDLEVEVPDPSAERMHFRFDGGEGIVMLMRPGYGRLVVADLLTGCAANA